MVKADFDITPVFNNYGATEFKITNTSAGTTKYKWTFDKGTVLFVGILVVAITVTLSITTFIVTRKKVDQIVIIKMTGVFTPAVGDKLSPGNPFIE